MNSSRNNNNNRINNNNSSCSSSRSNSSNSSRKTKGHLERVGSCRSSPSQRKALRHFSASFRHSQRTTRVYEFSQLESTARMSLPSAVTIERASPEKSFLSSEDDLTQMLWSQKIPSPISPFKDQFDEFVYKSQHIAHSDKYENEEEDQEEEGAFLRAKTPIRRCSHTGVLSPRRRHALVPGPPFKSSLLLVPLKRSRGSSLPTNIRLDQNEIYRLRNFSTSGSRVINQGDSHKRNKSNYSINSSSVSSQDYRRNSDISDRSDQTSDMENAIPSGVSSRRHSKKSLRQNPHDDDVKKNKSCSSVTEKEESEEPTMYRVVMLGAAGVGKSSLTSQFMSSDYMNTYDSVEDDVQKIVSVCVNGRESHVVFINHANSDMSVENQISTYDPNGYMVVFAVDEEDSLKVAERILQYLKSEGIIHHHGVILVANKVDLVRSRVISPTVGKNLAIKYECKYIETSPGMNHNVDELLVGILTQILLRENSTLQQDSNSKSTGSKLLKLMKRIWKIHNKSKSCENLHIL